MRTEELFYQKGYRVSSDGIVTNRRNQIINGYLANSGYIRISLQGIKCDVHRLQAYQKFGDILYTEGLEVRHFNNFKTDNSFDNILLGTHSENVMDLDESVRITRSSLSKKYHNKEEIQKFHSDNGNSYKLTMQKFNMKSKGTLHYLLK